MKLYETAAEARRDARDLSDQNGFHNAPIFVTSYWLAGEASTFYLVEHEEPNWRVTIDSIYLNGKKTRPGLPVYGVDGRISPASLRPHYQ